MGFLSFANKVLISTGFKLSEKSIPQRHQPVNKSSSAYSKRPKNIFNLYASEFGDIDSDKVLFYAETARKGMFFFKYLLFDDMRRRDLHTGGLLQKRKLSILGKLRHSKLDDLIRCEWDEGKQYLIDTFRQKSIMFPNFLSDILEAQFQGIAIFEKIFRINGSKIFLERIPLLPGHSYLYDDAEDKYEFLDPMANDTLLNRAAAATANDDLELSMLQKIDIPGWKRLEVHGYDGNNANGFMNGFTDSIIYANFIKSLSVKDWSIFLELYGLPPRLGKYDNMQMNDTDIRAFEDAVENFGNNYWAVISKDNDIDFKDFNKTASSDVFETFVDHIERKQSVRILGQNLTTQVSTEGSRAASKTHYEVEQDLLDSDILLLENTLDELMMDLLKMNFSKIPEEPQFRIPVAKSMEELTSKSTIYVNLKTLGYRPTQEALESEFGIELEPVAEAAVPDKENDENDKIDKKDNTDKSTLPDKNDEAEFTDKLIKELWLTL